LRNAAQPVIAGFVLGLAALLAVHFALLHSYWDYSEGVYALSAHQMLHGASLYSGFAGAQPPGVFLVGVVLLAIHDSLEWLRFAVALLQLGAGLLAGLIVLRVTGSWAGAALAPAAMLLTPWAVHEHGALTPELVALPVLIGAALLAGSSSGSQSSESRRAAATGVLCGLLVLIKYPYAIPALTIAAMSSQPRRVLVWALATVALGLGLTWLLAGASFWRDTVTAQTQAGSRSLGVLKGYWAQAGWNVLGLLVCASVAVRRRALAHDERMLRTSLALAVAMIVTFLTNFKVGTGLNITVPVEASLIAPAACGVVFAFRAAHGVAIRGARGSRVAIRGGRWEPALCVVAVLFTLAQSVSLIISPRHSIPFLRAGSRPAWGETLDGSQVLADAAGTRACPPGEPYGGAPLIALVAGRPVPAGQPDTFLIAHARVLEPLEVQVALVRQRCP
jgi:hypothetical protein